MKAVLTALVLSLWMSPGCTLATPDPDGGFVDCEGVTCPLGLSCDELTGACVSACCVSCNVSDPRTPCDETRCLTEPGYCSSPCESPNALTSCTACGPGANLGCPADFVCNQIASPNVCEAACLTRRCTQLNAHCNPETGECNVRPPKSGEVGTQCIENADCDQGAGMQCFSEAAFGFSGGYCSKFCSADVECPSGAFCSPEPVDEWSICVDGCDPLLGWEPDCTLRCEGGACRKECVPGLRECLIGTQCAADGEGRFYCAPG